MEVGGPGVPTLPAAGLVEEAPRQNLDSATILPHQMEGPGVQDHLLKDRTVNLKLAPETEGGDPGEVGPPAPGLAMMERRQEQDSATTRIQPMEEPGVLDLLLKLQDALYEDDASVSFYFFLLNYLPILICNASTGCPGSWHANYDTNKCYKFNKGKRIWEAARQFCQREKAVLAYVPDRKTDDFLTNMVMKEIGHCSNDHRNCEAWLGANDKSREGRWRWIDGNRSMRYSNWDVGEPNNHKHRWDDEDCLLTNWDGEMVGHTRWNDAPCSNLGYQFGFICQREPCHIERC